jgi:cyanate permease
MKQKKPNLLKKNQDVAFIAVLTAVVLLIPLIGMQYSNDWNWGLSDFVIAAVLIFGSGFIFAMAARRIKDRAHRIYIGLFILAVLLLTWAQLAVGIF